MKLGIRATWMFGAPAAVALVCLAAPGCTVTTSSGPPIDGGFEFPTQDSAAPDGAAQGVSDACSVCLFSQCSGLQSICDTNGECLAIYHCATQPTCASDSVCVQGCVDAHPDGETDYRALAKCDQESACAACVSPCQGTGIQAACPTTSNPPDADVADASTPTPDAAVTPQTCNQCQTASCASQSAACAAGNASGCVDYSDCLSACYAKASGDAQCTAGCDSVYPSGKTAATALADCTNTSCHAACFGSN